MTMKKKVENILGGFLERNKDYAISGNINNGIKCAYKTVSGIACYGWREAGI